MIYKYKDYIIWIVIYMLGTFYLYYCGIKNDWEEARITKGLEKIYHKNPPKFKQKCIVGDMTYSSKCTKLFVATSFISLFIMITFYVSADNKNFNNPLGVCTTFLSIVFIYSVFAGAPINDKVKLSVKDEKIYEKILNMISFIKCLTIKSITNEEYEYMQNIITVYITKWYENDDLKFGALIIRIDSDFFNGILPKDTKKEVKDVMKDSAYNILNLYNQRDATLLDRLIKLFDDEMINNGARIIDLAQFIKNHESVSKKITRNQIQDYVKKHIEVHKNKNIKTASLGDIESSISNNIKLSDMKTMME